jgi:uncharacterized protein DUF6599
MASFLCGCIFLGALLMPGSLVAAEAASLLPAEALGYRPEGTAKSFNRDNLFSLINGGAEVYRSLNVDTVLSQRYSREGSAEILVDLFDMGSSADAFGAYHHDMREEQDAGIGHESEYQGGSLYFWKGRYFVSVVAMVENQQTKLAVLSLGKAIAAAIGPKGEKPDLVGLLPQSGLDKSQVHYFHDWLLLNRHYFISDANILRLGKKTEGILARYRHSKSGSFALLLVRYESGAAADLAGKEFVKMTIPEVDDQGLAKAKDGKWQAVVTLENLLVIVLAAPLREEGLRLINEVKETQRGVRR